MDDNAKRTTIHNAVINSPNSTIENSFNAIHIYQTGFSEMPFLYSAMVCGGMAWFLAAIANYKLQTDMMTSLAFGSIAILLWVATIVATIFGRSVKMRG